MPLVYDDEDLKARESAEALDSQFGDDFSDAEKSEFDKLSQNDPPQNGGFFKATADNSKQFMRLSAKTTAVGGAATGIIAGGIIALIAFLSGPAELIHLSQILGKNFGAHQQATQFRTNALFRFAAAGDVGETRVTKVGSVVFGRTIAQLDQIGIKFERDPRTGNPKAMTLDTTKNPRYQGLSQPDALKAVAKDFKLKPNQLTPSPDGKITVNTRNFGIQATRSLEKGSLAQLEDGKVASAIKLRVVAKFFNTPSLFHPYKRGVASAENNTAIKKSDAKKKEEDRKKSKLQAVDQQSLEARERLKAKMGGVSQVTGNVLLLTTGMCLAHSISGNIVEINRKAVVAPAVVSTLDLMAAGEQERAGRDLTLSDAGATVTSLRNEDGTIWQGRALQETAGTKNPSGEEIPPEYKQAYNENTRAAVIKDTLGGGAFGAAACSPAGVVVQGIVGLGFLVAGPFTGGATWGAYTVAKISGSIIATGAALYFIEKSLTALLSDEPLVPTVLAGPVGGNIMAFSAREAANIDARASAGVALSSADTAYYEQIHENQELEEFKSKSFFARTFDTSDYRSVASQTFHKSGISSQPNIGSNVASLITSFGGIFPSIFSSLTPKAFAAEEPYDWGFPRFGIPPALLNDPKYEDPYENADKAAALFNQDDKYIKKADKCFGVKISRDNENDWNAVSEREVNPNSDEYADEKCSDLGDENWNRVIMFVFDTRTMTAVACFEKDQDACREIGIGQQSGSTNDPNSSAPVSGDVKSLAQQILDNPNITYPLDAVSPNGSTKKALEALARGELAPVTCANSSTRSTEVNINVLKFLAELGTETKIGVNALTDKCHSRNSAHYIGKAVDFECNAVKFDVAKGDEIAAKYGGKRNSETCAAHRHWHYNFL